MLACRSGPARAQRLEVVPDAGLPVDLAHGFEVVADGDFPAAQRLEVVPDAGLPICRPARA